MIVITGVPRSGKTTLASHFDKVFHTDDLIYLGWDESCKQAATCFDSTEYEVIEGVLVVRALRLWMKQHPRAKPVAKVIYLHTPREKLSSDQLRMATGLNTIWNEIRPHLYSRNVLIEERGSLIVQKKPRKHGRPKRRRSQ